MITRIDGHEANEKELSFLLQSIRVGDDEAAEVLGAIARGDAALWRIVAPGTQGVMVTCVKSKSLFVWHLAGEGLNKNMRKIVKEIQDIATRNDLRSVCTESIKPIARFLTHCGFKPVRVVMEWRA